jgi:hypothetical protein
MSDRKLSAPIGKPRTGNRASVAAGFDGGATVDAAGTFGGNT